jgi:hypothetical protein
LLEVRKEKVPRARVEMQKPRGTPPAHQGASRFTFEIASVIEPNPASLNIIDWWA